MRSIIKSNLLLFLFVQDELNASQTKQNTSRNSADQDEYDENEDSESKLEPTSWKLLDCKKMKVDELRTELMARDLDTRGLKGRLIVRLQEALDLEKVIFFVNDLVFVFGLFLFLSEKKRLFERSVRVYL